MPVRVNVNGRPPAPTAFSDNFNRPNADTAGRRWLRFLANAPSTAGVTASGGDRIVSNQLSIIGSGQNAPTVVFAPFFTPDIYPNIYNLNRTFIQADGISLAGAVTNYLALRFNWESPSGAGVREFDAYGLHNGGRVDRLTTVGTTTIIADQGWSYDGSTFMMRISGSNPVLIETFRNGVPGATFSDTDATRILIGGAGILQTLYAGDTTLVDVRFDNFSCGVW